MSTALKVIDGRGDPVSEVFGHGGILSKEFDGYEPRPAQIQLSNAVNAALERRDHLIAEAPTGTGKSFAYLVPAIAWAARNGKRVVIATENIALQEQLVGSDLPFLRSALPWKFDYVLFKGKSNYLCHSAHSRALYQTSPQQSMLGAGRAQTADGDLARILDWADVTETGDKAELNFIPDGRSWSRVSAGPDDCKGKRCRHFDDCYAMKARRGAANAQIIVCNHHLLFANIKYGGAVLPPFDAAIIDEAHSAADIARDFLGFRLTLGSIKRLCGRMRGLDVDGHETLLPLAERFFGDLMARFRSRDYGVRIKRPHCVDSDELLRALDNARSALAAGARMAPDDDKKADYDIEAARAQNARATISECMDPQDDNLVKFIATDREERNAWLEGKPLNVANILRASLFTHTESVIMVSATLSVDGSFDHAIDDIGALEPEELIVDSPFDPANRMMVVPDIPDPRDSEWTEEVCLTIEDAIKDSGGRALCLFTSYRVMNEVARHLTGTRLPFRVLVQGERPRGQLLDEFRSDVSSVLLGTRSFWAGVDVPGESCSLVIIDKMPFESPADPIVDAFGEKLGRAAFARRSVPRAIIQFKQGAGRLIRRTTDRGVIMMLDPRVVTKGYGRRFIRSMGDIKVSRDAGDVAAFLVASPAADPINDEIPF